MRPHGGGRELLGSGRVGSKEPVGQPATADVKRPHMLELEMRIARVVRADDDLRRAAAGICHGNALAGKIVGDPIECEPRLHLARDDLGRKAQSAQASERLLGVFRVACSTRQGDACRRGTESTGFLREGAARSLHAIDGAGAKTACRVHALSHVGNNGMLLRIHDRAIAHACEREPR